VLVPASTPIPNPPFSLPQLCLRSGAPPAAPGPGNLECGPRRDGPGVRRALELAHLHIDSESIYGNEAEIGAALQQALNDGVVRRE